jgi:TonB family protein
MFQPRACCRSALGLVAFVLGCSQSASPPEAPIEAPPESASAVPERMDESSTSAEASSPEAMSEASTEAVAPDSPTAAPPAPQAPRDSRGKEQIQEVMAANRDKVRACYDASLAKNPGIVGQLVVDFVINPRGDVKQAEVNWSASEIHVPELDACAADAVRALKFPPSSRGLESKVSYPFNFNPPRTDPPKQKP